MARRGCGRPSTMWRAALQASATPRSLPSTTRHRDAHPRRRLPARDQHLRAIQSRLGSVPVRRRLPGQHAWCGDAGAHGPDLAADGRFHPRRTRARLDAAAVDLGRCDTLRPCHARRLRAHRYSADRRCPPRWFRRRLPGSARRRGGRTCRRRRRRIAAATARCRRRADAHRRQPRPACQRDGTHAAPRQRDDGLPHLPACGHGRNRRTCRRAAVAAARRRGRWPPTTNACPSCCR